MNTFLKIWTTRIKESGINNVESFGILSAQNNGFRRYKGTLYTLSSLLTSMEDA
jgi:hypothetical protein